MRCADGRMRNGWLRRNRGSSKCDCRCGFSRTVGIGVVWGFGCAAKAAPTVAPMEGRMRNRRYAMKKVVVEMGCCLVLLTGLWGGVVAGDYKLPDTGIEKCYDAGGESQH